MSDNVEFAPRGIQDTKTGGMVTLAQALSQGIINPARGTVRDGRTGRTMQVNE